MAAILIVFLPSFTASPCGSTHPADEVRRGSRKGAGPLGGESLHGKCQRFWLARNVSRRGGNHPRPGFPLWGNGKGKSNSLLPARLLLRLSVSCSLFDFISGHSRFPIIHSCRASIRTLNEPQWLGACWGPVSSPRSITVVTDLGCQGAAI